MASEVGTAAVRTRVASSARAWVLPSVAIVALGVAAQFAYPPNDDATWLMAVARRLLDGGTLYSADLVEINPPLIFWITGIAVRLADAVRLDAVVVWRLVVAAQVALVMWLTARTLAVTEDADDVALHPLVLAVVAVLLTCLPAWHFGQREHLILLWFTPYIFASAGWLAGVPAPPVVRHAAGVLVGLAVALKPHYGIAIVLVEAGIALRRRSLSGLVRPTLVSAAVVGALYLLAVTIWFPAYFSFAVPLARRYYHAYSALQVPVSHAVYGLILVGSVLGAGRAGIAAIRAQLFALAAMGAYAAFLIQHMGWPYHFLPAKTFVFMVVAVSLPAAWRTLLPRLAAAHRPRLVAASCILCLAGAGALSWLQWAAFEQTRQARVIRNVSSYLAALDVGQGEPRFAALSLTLFPAFPVNEMLHAQWSSRFSCLWMLPGILDSEAESVDGQPARDPIGRQYLEGAVSDDFDRWRPDVVLVEESRQVSALDQLLKSPRFRRIWSDYQLVGRVEYFQVFRRIAPPAPSASAAAAVQALHAHGGEAPAAVPSAAGRLEGGPQYRALGREARVAPVVGTIGVDKPHPAAEAR
jgi:hypothetical protein